MNRDSRLSSVLHLLLHLTCSDRHLTSEQLAGMLGTNPVLVRRMLAGLRERGLVSAEKGHGGGWVLARPVDAVTLYEVYEALGEPALFAIGYRSTASPCLVEQAVNSSLEQTLQEARGLVLSRLREVSLAALLEDIAGRDHGGHHGMPHASHEDAPGSPSRLPGDAGGDPKAP